MTQYRIGKSDDPHEVRWYYDGEDIARDVAIRNGYDVLEKIESATVTRLSLAVREQRKGA